MSEPSEVDKPRQGNDQTNTRSRKVLKRLAVMLLLLVFAFLVAVSIPDIISNMFGHAAQASCATAPVTASSLNTGPIGKNSQLVTAKLESGRAEEVDFGRSVTSRGVTAYLDLSSIPSGSLYFHIRLNPFVRSDDATLRPQNISAIAERDGTTLILNICFDRNGGRNTNLGDPGSYMGSVTVDDSRLSGPVAIPVTVTMSIIQNPM